MGSDPIFSIQIIAQKPLPDGYPKECITIGDHLRKRRIDLGMHQAQVAKKFNVTTCTITNWELNHTNVPIKHAPIVIKFLGYNPLELHKDDSLGARMKYWRLKHGISITQFQSIIKMDSHTITKIENGNRVIKKTMLRAEEFLSKNG